MNKVPKKKGYVPNMYTGRSVMDYGRKGAMGGMYASRKKAAMGMSRMDEEMSDKMRKQMMGGSRMQYNQGSYVSVQDMEKHCSSKMKKNTMK